MIQTPRRLLTRKALLTILCLSLPMSPAVAAQASDFDTDLAIIDAGAATLHSIRSWVRGEPEAAKEAFLHHEAVRKYLDNKYKEYTSGPSATSLSENPLAHRMGDRLKSIEAAVREWDGFTPRFEDDMRRQISTELKRQRDAVERYKKSKSPRPSSFAYIPKTVWQTKDKLDVLTAFGVDTKELQAEQAEVEHMVLELLASLDVEQIAKKNGYVRDGYRRDDRDTIEAFVAKTWNEAHPNQPLVRVVMPTQSWSNTYGVRATESGELEPNEIDRLTVYVAVQHSDDIYKLHPMRLMREHYRINGKRLGKVGPQPLQQIATNEFPFHVLAKNIR